MSEKKKYDSEFEGLSFYYIGGLWGYAIIRLKDANGVRKIRLAKCKKKKEFPKTDKFEWWNIDPVHVKDLSQVNKINFKRKEEFEAVYSKVLEEFEKIDESKTEITD